MMSISMRRDFALGLLFCGVSSFATDYPTSLYEEWRLSSFPQQGIEVQENPTALLWPSVKRLEKKTVTYNVYLSQDSLFASAPVLESLNQRMCFYNPHQKLDEGVWYWKYEVVDKEGVHPSPRMSFRVAANTPGIETPTVNDFAARLKPTHPRVYNYGRDLAQIRRDAPSHPLYASMMRDAKKAMQRPIYRGPVDSDDLAEARRLKGVTNTEIDRYHKLLEGYLLSADKQLLTVILERTDVLLSWPTDDLLGSRVMGALAMGYDLLYDTLSDEVKTRILTVIDKQFQYGLKKWPGYVEARHVENHFWQMELAGNFKAAIATLHHLESAQEILAYTYGLFVARFPNLATQDGGWAEGEGYYSVNQSAIVDMALLIKKLGQVDIYQMGWYANLCDYFTYFSPLEAPLSGFGDMHDRSEVGNRRGRSEMLVMGCEEHDTRALYRLFTSLDPKIDLTKATSASLTQLMAQVEPWYQIVHNIRINPADVKVPTGLPHDKVFEGVGVVAMHDDVLRPDEQTSVFFRSSPFGSKGHMHNNQNAFNLARKGQRIFYSTGYYTSFSDPHALTSYRHTRAHNAILVNGMGQAYGHEGYGWLKRHIEGESISYVCGDATPAYKQTTDEQFIKFHQDGKLAMDASNGLGTAPVERVERHLAFVRPDLVVIYDVLEATEPVTWSFLLHSYEPMQLQDGLLRLTTDRNDALATVWGSKPLESSLTDAFYIKPNDKKKKYKKGTPDQFHATYSNTEKCASMRFLSVIRLSDAGVEPVALTPVSDGVWQVGDVRIEAELIGSKPARAVITYGDSCLDIMPDKTSLQDNGKNQEVTNSPLPIGNWVY